MNETERLVTEAELHAYADGQLPQAERARIEAFLADHPAEAALVATWHAQSDAIRALYAPHARARASDTLMVEARVARKPMGKQALIAASLLAAFLLGGAAGRILPNSLGMSGAEIAAANLLPKEAQNAFLIYAGEVRHPVEVFADEETHLVAWLGKRLSIANLTVPQLQNLGFHLVGGRLLPVDGAAGALLMYEDASGKRLTMLVGRSKTDKSTSFRFASAGSLETFYWIDNGLAYAVTGEISRDALRQIAEECYRQLERA